MEDSQGEVQKNLIKIDNELPVFKNSTKVTNALQELIGNSFISKVCLQCDKSLLVKAFVEYVKKTAKFSFKHINALKIVNIEDIIRKNIFLCIKSSRDIYEGEITAIKLIKNEHSVLQSIEMSLKSQKSTKVLSLSKNLVKLVEEVNIGDVVYVEPNSGILKRIGRSETRINEFDLEGDKHVQLHKGGVHSTREKDIYISLYDFDYAFNKYNENISDFTRRHVDDTVSSYLKSGIAQFVCSGVYIENISSLEAVELYRLINVSNLYPHLKILIDTVSIECNSIGIIKKHFLFINCIGEENVVDLFKYFSKGHIKEEFNEVIAEVLTYDNYEAVNAALSVSDSVVEFKEIFY